MGKGDHILWFMVLEWIMETLTFPLHPIKQITVHVSCCYDRGYTVMPAYMFQYKWIANKTRFISDPAFDIKGRNLAVEFQCMALSCLKQCANKMPLVVVSHIFLFQPNIMTIPSQRGFFFLHIIKKNPLHLPHLCLHFQFAYQRNPIGTCFAYLHMISNFKWTCQKWSNFLFWMCEDYLACIISASTCNIAKKQNKLISNNTRGTFYIAFH